MRGRALAANLLLAASTSVVLLGALEGLARVLEARRAPRRVAEYIWDWEKQWAGQEFYVVGSNASGWPPEQEWNADGVRDRAHAVEKEEGVPRVAFLGDSVTLGAGVEPGQAYPQVVQSLLDGEGRRVEVMNVALWGWSTRQQVIAYDRILRRYRPDLVVLAVCLNDVPELQNNLVRPPRWLAGLHGRSALVRWLVNAEGREIADVEELVREPGSPRVQEAFGRFFAEVRALRERVRQDGAALALVVFPFRFQIEKGAPPPSAQQTLRSFCEAEGLRCLDLLPALREAGLPAFLDYDHLSVEGARVVARAILGSGLLPQGAPAPALPADAVALARALQAPEAAARASAARALGEHGREAVEPLLAALRDEREVVRFHAARSLHRVGPAAQDVARLVAALDNPDPYVRSFAAWTLGGLGSAAAPALPALVAAYEREEKEGRGAAVQALAQLGPLAKDAVPALVRGLANPVSHRRWSTARALARIGPEARAAVPALIAALADGNEHVRVHAALALGRIGPDAAPAIAPLTEALQDPSEAVRREAATAIKRIRGLAPAGS